MTCRADISRLNWILLIKLSKSVRICSLSCGSFKVKLYHRAARHAGVHTTSQHIWNGQTLQVCASGSHCWDHEPALVCLSEKTANDCSLFSHPFSLSIHLGLYLGLKFAPHSSFVFGTPSGLTCKFNTHNPLCVIAGPVIATHSIK